jgi:hypothetical protein
MIQQAPEQLGTDSRGRSKMARTARAAFRFVEPFAMVAESLKDEFLGSYYGGQDPYKRPFNQIHDHARVLLPSLVSRNPVIHVSPKRNTTKILAELHKMELEHALDEMQYWQTARKIATDAFFSIGIAYCGVADSGYEVYRDGQYHREYEPFVDWVSLTDFGVDPVARNPDEAQHFVRRGLYRISTLLDMEEFAGYEDALRTLPRYTDGYGETDSRDIGNPLSRMEADEDGDWVYLTEMFFTRTREIQTLAASKEHYNDAIPMDLGRREWNGPDDPTGPYDFLGFSWLPDTFFPAAPAAIAYDMHKLLNQLGEKVANQIRRSKNLVVGPDDSRDDMETIRDAEDLDVLNLGDPNAIKSILVGHPNPDALAIIQWMRQISGEQQGLAEQVQDSGGDRMTATQATFIQGARNVRTTDMQGQTDDFHTRIMRRFSWWLWNNPLPSKSLMYRVMAPGVPGGAVEIPVQITPEMRDGDWIDYALEIRPFSSGAPDEPMVRFTKLQQWMQNVVAPAVQLHQATGGAFNADAVIMESGALAGFEHPERFWNADMARMMVEQTMGAATGPLPSTLQASAGAGPQGGIPGSPGQGNGVNTGAGSPNFDTQANTAATVEAV